MFKYNCGGCLGNATFIWKVGNEIDQTKQIKAITEARKMIPKFEKAAFAKEIRNKYCKITSGGITPVVRRNLVEFLTGQISRYHIFCVLNFLVNAAFSNFGIILRASVTASICLV